MPHIFWRDDIPHPRIFVRHIILNGEENLGNPSILLLYEALSLNLSPEFNSRSEVKKRCIVPPLSYHLINMLS